MNNGERYQFESQAIEWYCLLALHDHVSQFSNGNIVLEGLARAKFREYTKIFYAAVLDYLTSIVYGEARHAPHCCKYHIPEIDKAGGGRQEQYAKAKNYDPLKSLPHIVKLYHYPWAGGYGGKKWGKIAIHALEMWQALYQEIENEGKLVDMMTTLLDTAVSLAHNGGLAYDKPTIFTCKKYDMMQFLDYRQHCPSSMELVDYIRERYPLTEETWQLIAMVKEQEFLAFMYNQTKQGVVKIMPENSSVRGYQRINWGSGEISEPVDKHTGKASKAPSLKGVLKKWYEDHNLKPSYEEVANYAELMEEFTIYPTERGKYDK